ncbi:MAG: GerW family sporulation protein [Clostridiales bacterium]|nr:GerW family sporulation protein [Clostridiales bacterium]MCF8022083.1 GerW family sporulation protein [Clostridiales bacterium]
MLNELFSGIENLKDYKTVLGDPVHLDAITLVPVLSIRVGIGSCQSENIDNSGGGGGFSVEPRAVIAIKGENVSVYSLKRKDSIDKLAEVVPEIKQLWERDSYGNM